MSAGKPKLKLVVDNVRKPVVCYNKDAVEAAMLLTNAFDWDLTEEGVEFWNTVYKRLVEIAHDKRYEKV